MNKNYTIDHYFIPKSYVLSISEVSLVDNIYIKAKLYEHYFPGDQQGKIRYLRKYLPDVRQTLLTCVGSVR